MYDIYSRELMTRTYFGCEISDIAKSVILTPIWDLNDFKKSAACVIKEFEGWYKGVTVKYDDKILTVICSEIGSPMTGDCVLALQYTDCEHVYFSGSAGAINEDLHIGDLLVVDEAVIGEGFSRYHQEDLSKDCFGKLMIGSSSLAAHLLSDLKAREKQLDVKTQMGRIFTIDSILGESREAFAFMMDKGCDAVEMEVSSVFTAASKIKRKAVALILISDLPLKKNSLFDGISEEDQKLFKTMRKKMPQLLMDVVLKGEI